MLSEWKTRQLIDKITISLIDTINLELNYNGSGEWLIHDDDNTEWSITYEDQTITAEDSESGKVIKLAVKIGLEPIKGK